MPIIGDDTGDASLLKELDRIGRLHTLFLRQVALRQWRLHRLDNGLTPQRIYNLERQTNWAKGLPLFPPSDDNLLDLPVTEQEAEAQAVLALEDMDYEARKIEQSFPGGANHQQLSYLNKHFPDTVALWMASFCDRREADVSALNAAAAKKQKAYAFYTLRRDFVGMEFLEDVIWGLKLAADVERQFAGASGGENRTKSLHMAFVAEPGMGKSTAVYPVAEALQYFGLLQKDKVTPLSMANIAAPTLGAEEQNIRQAFDSGRGGVVFFDEADTAAGHLSKGQKRSAVVQLLNQLAESDRADTCLIIACYPRDLEALMSSDAGFRSRFGNRILHFPPKDTAQFVTMFEREMKSLGVSLDGDEARASVWDFFSDLRKNKAHEFANGRSVRDFAQAMKAVLGRKYAHDGMAGGPYGAPGIKSVKREISAEDIEQGARSFNRGPADRLDVFNETNPYRGRPGDGQERERGTLVRLPVPGPGGG